MGNLNQIQSETLIEYKKNINQICEELKYDLNKEFDDYDYLRFLRARNFILKDSIAMLTKYIKWRIDQNVDMIFVYIIRNIDFLKLLK